MPSSPSDKQVILVTGANKGIGYEAVKLLSHQLPSSTILLATRSLDNGQKAILKMKQEESSHAFDNVKAVELDVTKQASISKAAELVKKEYGRLDVLICNAGVAGESAQTVFAVNIDGVHDCIEAFLPIIPATGQIVVVASEVGAWAVAAMPAELQQKLTAVDSITWPAVQQLEADWLSFQKGQPAEQPWSATDHPVTNSYSISKALVIAYLRWFALQHAQPKLVIVCPGYCSTDINHNSGGRPAFKGGESVCWPVLHPAEAESGQFYQDGAVQSFVKAMPQWAADGFKKHAEEAAAKAKAQGKESA